MKAMVMNGFGDSQVFTLSEIPKPQIKSGHVLVRVRASSVNPIDYKIRSGLLKNLAPENGVLGFDVAGIVEEVGKNVNRLKPGDEVYGCSGAIKGNPGAMAEYQLVDERLLSIKPENLSMEQCAALPLVGITSWDALVRGAKITSGEKVLVHGGAGGVGHFGVQLAKLHGAEVFSTVSSDQKAEIVKSYGATPINYKKESLTEYVNEHTDGDGFDVVFDTVGGDNLMRCFEASKLEGRVTSVNTRVECDLSILHQKALSLHVVFMIIPILYDQKIGKSRHGEVLKEISKHAKSESIVPLIHNEVYSFESISEAHTLLESGKAIGKVILRGFD
ncbi:MAG: quinone oxidoreductase [Verrucomicrobiales bacterium]|nr:quinone oxidoreductase [Verrucomicrobiales bacterium]